MCVLKNNKELWNCVSVVEMTRVVVEIKLIASCVETIFGKCLIVARCMTIGNE